jgi:ribosome-associated protein
LSFANGVKILPNVVIPFTEMEFSYTHSSGAGGQNVNKVATKAVLRWSPSTSASVPDGVKRRFIEAFGSKLTHTGELILTSQKSRSQAQNANDCLDKLREMVLSVWRAPKIRRATKPTKGSQRRRVEGKKIRSNIKQMRKKVSD